MKIDLLANRKQVRFVNLKIQASYNYRNQYLLTNYEAATNYKSEELMLANMYLVFLVIMVGM